MLGNRDINKMRLTAELAVQSWTVTDVHGNGFVIRHLRQRPHLQLRFQRMRFLWRLLLAMRWKCAVMFVLDLQQMWLKLLSAQVISRQKFGNFGRSVVIGSKLGGKLANWGRSPRG